MVAMSLGALLKLFKRYSWGAAAVVGLLCPGESAPWRRSSSAGGDPSPTQQQQGIWIEGGITPPQRSMR